MCIVTLVQDHTKMAETPMLATAHCFMLPGTVWPTDSLFSKRSSVIEMKPATLAPQDTMVSLKA